MTLAEGLRKVGLDDATYIVLYFVQRAGGGGASTRSISETIQMPISTLNATAKRLVRDSWLTEEPDPADRESRHLSLTPKAATVIPLLSDAAHWAIQRALSGFDETEIAQLTEYLERMKANLR
ncbi:MAG TPA: MarR family transcriptional regulator, partial [Coriobacteriia bacterium]